MSKGGKFILQQNEAGNAQDLITLNLKMLEERIAEIKRKDCKEYVKPNWFMELAQRHSVFIKKYYKPAFATAYEWTNERIGSGGELQFDTENSYLLPQYGDFIGEAFIYVKFSGLSAVSPLDKCGYYDFLGHKLMQHVALEFSGNTIDEYYSDAYNMYFNYHVPEDKKKAWMRGVGQEYPQPVLIRQDGPDEYREQKFIVNGPQTAKNVHGDVELWIPLLFDFAIKPHCPIFSAAIPIGQRYIKVTTPTLESLIFVEDNGGGGAINLPTVTSSLWINQIFIHPSVVDELKKRDYTTTIRSFKTQTFNASELALQKLDEIRLQVENMYVGLRPNANTGPTNWWRFHSTTPLASPVFPVRQQYYDILSSTYYNQLAFAQADIYNTESPITEMNLVSQDIVVNNPAGKGFYNVLQPLAKSISPYDPGILMFSFSQKNNQTAFPSYSEDDSVTSYFNVSTGKEFYLNYKALASSLPATITVVARVINWFVVRSNGIVYIKYKS